MNSLKRDLVERRLWPLAIVLVAAIVAVPFLLHGHHTASADPIAPAPVPKAGAASTSTTSTSSTATTAHRTRTPALHMSNSRDPFAAGAVGHTHHAASSGGSASASVSAASPTVVDGSGTSTGSASASASTGTTTSLTSTPPAATGATSPSTPTTATTPTTVTPPTTVTSTPAARSWTIYRVDVRYGLQGKPASLSDLARLSPLPAQRPKAMFAGVTDHGHEAAFLIGAGVGATGQGRCHPSRSSCAMVTLAPGQREALFYLVKDGGGRTTILRLAGVTKSVTHSARAAQAAYDRHSTLGLCDLMLGDPLGFVYDSAQGSLRRLQTAACRRNHAAVAFPGTAGGAGSSVLP